MVGAKRLNKEKSKIGVNSVGVQVGTFLWDN